MQPSYGASSASAMTDLKVAGPIHKSNAEERDIVATGTIDMLVDDPVVKAQEAAALVASKAGRVDSRTESAKTDSQGARATLLLRIPSENLDSTTEQLKKIGTLQEVSINKEDVTTQRVDMDQRLASLQASVNRLLDLIRTAANTSDVLEAETQLTQRQGELQSLTAQREQLGDKIAYSSITLTLSSSPENFDRDDHDGISGAFIRGWKALWHTVGTIIYALGFLFPWLVALSLIIGVIAIIGRLRRYRMRNS
ncbi:MAG: DUF4349 domain-containing protein [Mycobacteriaceae bacterium]